jgi:hypothetical protein
MIISSWILLSLSNISHKVAEEIKTHILCSITLFPKMCRIFICGLFGFTIFSHIISYNGTTFGKNILLNCVFSLQLLPEIFIILRTIERDIVENVHNLRLYVKCVLFLSDFNKTWIYKTYSRKIFKYQISQNPSSGSRVVPCGQTNMTKLIVAFLNFTNAPKNRIRRIQFWITE